MQKRRLWTPDEETELVRLSEIDSMSLEDIAAKLNRTREACRIKLQDIRKRGGETPVKIVLAMSPKEYNALIKDAEAGKDFKRLQSFADENFSDYKSLYSLCGKLIKAYENHRNMKPLFEELSAEMEVRYPCPF